MTSNLLRIFFFFSLSIVFFAVLVLIISLFDLYISQNRYLTVCFPVAKTTPIYSNVSTSDAMNNPTKI